FSDLGAGSYYVRVQSADCETVSQEIPIEQPEPLVVNYDVVDVSCRGENDGSIQFDVEGGTGDYQYAISPNLSKFDDQNGFDELDPGDYEVIVQDANGCFEFIQFSITEPDEITLAVTGTDEICLDAGDGTLSISIEGGTAPYSTSLNDKENFIEGKTEYEGLTSGSYIVYVQDANGCEKIEVYEIGAGANLSGEVAVAYGCDTSGVANNTVSVVFEDPTVTENILYGLDTTDPAEMVLDGTFSDIPEGGHFIYVVHGAGGCDATFDFEIQAFEPLQLILEERSLNHITAVAQGGAEPYSYRLEDGNETSDNVFNITETATYEVTVTDANGCAITESIFMEFIDIEIPNFFTPDGDGKNDLWGPKHIEQYPDIFIKVFDRYGRTIYRFKNNQDGWDGFYQNSQLPSGDYWYIIKLNGESDQREFVGHFTLYR
ncbi:MAG: T9SS type B sorting domain-containing protein, partial [Bacteroidota bacterium]